MDQPPNGRHFSDVELLPSAQPRISKSEDTPNEIGEKKDATSEIKSWRELTWQEKLKRVVVDYLLMLCLFIGCLYVFICSLSIMGSAFQLLGGKDAGQSLSNNELFDNPVAGVVLGVLSTVLLQSSSTTTSIMITMTAAEILTVEQAIYMVMGANIGTSVTNTIVALGQIKDREQFELAFSGATVHDMFNFLTVIVLLPVEAATGYLRSLTAAVIESWHLETDTSAKKDLLKKVTLPLTNRIVQIDKNPIALIAKGELAASEARLLKATCSTIQIPSNCTEVISAVGYNVTNATAGTTVETVTAVQPTVATTLTGNFTDFAFDGSNETASTGIMNCTEVVKIPCDYLFHNTSLSESAVGAILLVCSLVVLCVSLVFMVKILTRLLHGRVAESVKGFVNAEFPGKAAYFTGYLAILIGAGLTILVQSSSVFTSALTPLVGIGIIDLERMYPLTLGANIGTTVTGMLAALASSNVEPALRVAMAHLFFNISGIIIWYVVPVMRKPPIGAARFLGRTTMKYRWFAIAYLIVVFFMIPLALFGLSLAGWKVLLGVGTPIVILIIAAIILKILQLKVPNRLPLKLRNWHFMPIWLRSLEPYDRIFKSLTRRTCCGHNRNQCNESSGDSIDIRSSNTSNNSEVLPTPWTESEV